MLTLRSVKIKIVFGALVLFSGACSDSPRGKLWGVLVSGLPSQITTKEYRGNVTYYVLKQTHEPILRKDDGQNYTSRLLNKWSRSIDYTRYVLCPNMSLSFTEKDQFSAEFFAKHINTVTKRFDPAFSVTAVDRCFEVKFAQPRKSYADFLSLYENAPTLKQSNDIEIGLGAFYVKEIKSDAITLARKEPIRNGYNKIVLYEYQGAKDPRLQNRDIKDFNLIPDFDIPKWALDEYIGFVNMELRSMLLIINHPDLSMREAIYNCADVRELRKSYFPQKNNFFDIQNILPVGVFGAKAGVPRQECSVKYQRELSKTSLVFANWMHGNNVELNNFAKKFSLRTGADLKVVDFVPRELVKLFNKSPRPYNLLIILFDSVRPDPNAFFDSFAKNNGFHDFYMPAIKQMYEDLNREDDEAKRRDISMKITEEISRNSLAVPLYQSVRTLYYPSEIRNFTVGKGFLEYPEVAEFRW